MIICKNNPTLRKKILDYSGSQKSSNLETLIVNHLIFISNVFYSCLQKIKQIDLERLDESKLSLSDREGWTEE